MPGTPPRPPVAGGATGVLTKVAFAPLPAAVVPTVAAVEKAAVAVVAAAGVVTAAGVGTEGGIEGGAAELLLSDSSRSREEERLRSAAKSRALNPGDACGERGRQVQAVAFAWVGRQVQAVAFAWVGRQEIGRAHV